MAGNKINIYYLFIFFDQEGLSKIVPLYKKIKKQKIYTVKNLDAWLFMKVIMKNKSLIKKISIN